MTDIEQQLQVLSLEEKVRLCAGASMWRTHALDDHHIPAVKVSDGPNGVRGDGGVPSASFPVGTALASTWNAELIKRVGQTIGREARQKDVQVVLGPTINLHRTPLAGRNFECYSEDPYLSGKIATAFVRGVQSEGVAACPKHLVCNDSEFERQTISSEVDERTLREIYLKPFEMVIRDASPWTLMTAYNRINGTYASAHDEIVNGIVRGELGFDGLVISDWWGARGTVGSAGGGLDLEMPGPARVFGDALLDAVRAGEVAQATIDDKVRRLLQLQQRCGISDRGASVPERGEDLPEHRQTTYQAAAESMVLVKNEAVLPLAAETIGTLALIGPNAAALEIMGGGSSTLQPHPVVTPAAAFETRLGANAQILLERGCDTHRYVPAPPREMLLPELGSGASGSDASGSGASGLLLRTYASKPAGIEAEPLAERLIGRGTVFLQPSRDGAAAPGYATLEGYLRVQVSAPHEFGVFATGRSRIFVDDELVADNWSDPTVGDAFFGRGSTEVRGRVDLAAGQNVRLKIEFEGEAGDQMNSLRYGAAAVLQTDLIGAAEALAANVDAVVLVVGTNDDWETEGSDREDLSLPGAQDELVRRVVAANPRTVVVVNTGAVVAMPWFDEAPAVLQAWLPGQEGANALADIVLGHVNPSGRLPTTLPRRIEDTPAYDNYPGEFGRVHYGENLFMGYRWFDRRDISPLLPFGHGLSYSEFEYRNLEMQGRRVRLVVHNASTVDGLEVVQLYVAPTEPSVARPDKELRAFTKVAVPAQQSAEVVFDLDDGAFAHWDPLQHAWVVEPGRYRLLVGASSRDIRADVEVTV